LAEDRREEADRLVLRAECGLPVVDAPVWKRRRVRGAPVGTNPDGTPVLFTLRIQVKVYRGEGSDAGLPLRVLRGSARSIAFRR
jgi:hypothetical protein